MPGVVTTKTFWTKQLFRLAFGMVCAWPLLTVVFIERQNLAVENFLFSTLIFIFAVLPLLNCRPFFRLWERYLYFRRACVALLALRCCDFIIIWNNIIIFPRSEMNCFTDCGIVVTGAFVKSMLFILLGLSNASSGLLPDFLFVTSLGFTAYIVLWTVIGVFFFLQVILHYITNSKWEYK